MIGIAVTLVEAQVFSQDLGGQLGKLAGDNAKNYVTPLMTGWGADLNSGFYHSADLHDVLGFDVQLKFTGARVSDEDKTYMFVTPDQITYGALTLRANLDYDKLVQANSVVGAKSETVVRTRTTSVVPNQEILRLPAGFDLPASPLIVPQVAIGLPFGLEVMGRFIPKTKITSNGPFRSGDDLGKLNMLGFGIRYNIDQYIPLLPIGISVHFMTQKLKFTDTNDNDLISASATAYGVEVSKSLLLLTLYGGVQLESSSWTIGPYKASFQEGTSPRTIDVPEFTVDGKNSSRALVGVRLQLLLLNFHADYSLAKIPVLTLGAGISIR